MNCNTKVNKININAITKAFPKNATVSNCCSFSPVCLTVTPSEMPLKLPMYWAMTAFTAVGLKPWSVWTFDLNWINLFWFFLLMLPKVFVGSTFTSELIGIFLTIPPAAISLKDKRMFNKSTKLFLCNSSFLNWILYSSLPSLILETSLPNKAVRICMPTCALLTPSIKARSLSMVKVNSGFTKSTSIFNPSIPGICAASK